MSDSAPNLHLQIKALNSSGQGIGDQEGLKIFIDLALPGETVETEIVVQKKNYATGKLLKIEKKSLDRVQPICPIFEWCGGCQIMHLNYPKQLEYKTQKVMDSLKRIGKLSSPTVLPCLESPQPLHYRNKIQLPFFEKNQELKLGLYEKHSNDVVEVETCFIHSELGQKVYDTLLKLLKNTPLKSFNESSKEGLLRHLLMRTGIFTHECLLVFITASNRFQKELKQVAEEIMKIHPEVKGVLQNINKKRFNSIMGDTFITLKGRSFYYEKLLGKTFKISAHAFFQVNSWQAQNLYRIALDFADLQHTDRILDAYCGIGMFSVFAASKVSSVHGVESISSAIEDARENAALNQIENAVFQCARLENVIESLGAFDVVFINPPRKGCDPQVIQQLCKIKPRKIIYISCDPATLSRDIYELSKEGYTLEKVQPLDMFPQTTHVESIALLTSST